MGEHSGGRGAGRDESVAQGGADVGEPGSGAVEAVDAAINGGVDASTETLVEAWGRRLLPRRRSFPVRVESTSNRRRRASFGLVAMVAMLLLGGCFQPGSWIPQMTNPAGKPVTHACGAITWGVQPANPADPMFRSNVRSVILQVERLTGRRFTEVPYNKGRIRVSESWPAASTNTRAGYAAITSDGWHYTVNTVYINPRSTAPNSLMRIGVLRHEIGHAMGLNHTTADPSIMNPNRYVNDFSAKVDIPALRYLATHC